METPNVILWHFVGTQQDAANAVSEGRADWLNGPIPLSLYRSVATRPLAMHTASTLDR
jgi:hypothetical protein